MEKLELHLGEEQATATMPGDKSGQPTIWFGDHVEDGTCLEIVQRLNAVETLYDAIAHGDFQHRAWLRKAISDHFAGRPVQRPQ
ncbi:MAG: hypothetical protein JO256_09100 [Alphaproteobacteria bacterium]|nr:hypothetical protein [Alphaproteobacteria bacterium]